jgi:hypothetical protein
MSFEKQSADCSAVMSRLYSITVQHYPDSTPFRLRHRFGDVWPLETDTIDGEQFSGSKESWNKHTPTIEGTTGASDLD